MLTRSLPSLLCVLWTAQASAQVRPLDSTTYSEAVAAGKSHTVQFLQYKPFEMRAVDLMARRDQRASSELIGTMARAPWGFEIETPFSRVAVAVANAIREHKPIPADMMKTANDASVSVLISPGETFAQLQPIKRVVLKRGDSVIEASNSRIDLTTVVNDFGVKRTSSNAVFTFPLDAFSPGTPLTVVMIGESSNLEWTITADEIVRLR